MLLLLLPGQISTIPPWAFSGSFSEARSGQSRRLRRDGPSDLGKQVGEEDEVTERHGMDCRSFHTHLLAGLVCFDLPIAVRSSMFPLVQIQAGLQVAQTPWPPSGQVMRHDPRVKVTAQDSWFLKASPGK